EFERGGNCLSRAGEWEGALEAYSHLPTTPENNRRVEACRFRIGLKKNNAEALVAFFKHTLADEYVDPKDLADLARALLAMKRFEEASVIFTRIASLHQQKDNFIEAARSLRMSGD